MIKEFAAKAKTGAAELDLPHVGTLVVRSGLAACRFEPDLAEDARNALAQRMRGGSPAFGGGGLTPSKLRLLSSQH